MNRNELISESAESVGTTKAHMNKALDAILDAVVGALERGDDVRLLNFGTFLVASRPEKEGRNPRTGEPIRIPASRQVKFKPGKSLKDRLNK